MEITEEYEKYVPVMDTLDVLLTATDQDIDLTQVQAADLYENATFHVIPSKNIGAGYVALSSLDFESEDVDGQIAAMMEAMGRVTAGYISPSIRDTEMNGLQIHNGDTIGIIEKEIVVSEADQTTATCRLASMLLDRPDAFMLTVFCGVDAGEAEKEEMTRHLAETHPDAEVYFIDGGQDIYPYIFVAE